MVHLDGGVADCRLKLSNSRWNLPVKRKETNINSSCARVGSGSVDCVSTGVDIAMVDKLVYFGDEDAITLSHPRESRYLLLWSRG